MKIDRKIRITYVSTNRADYEPFRVCLKSMNASPLIDLSIVAAGNLTSPENRTSIQKIHDDGLNLSQVVQVFSSEVSEVSLGISIGKTAEAFSRIWELSRPDILLVLGDRFELLPICSIALLLRIPIAHVSGGDITEGAIDDQVRHAITKMASLHFPGTTSSASRIKQMGEEEWRIHMVGEPGIDNFRISPKIGREKLAETFKLDASKSWILFTYHPETHGSVSRDVTRVRMILDQLIANPSLHILATHPNADLGSQEIMAELYRFRGANSERATVVNNAGHENFINLMRESTAIVGNSSSIVFESPSAGIPAINVGRRQDGRLLSENIVSVSGDSREEFSHALNFITTQAFLKKCQSVTNPYGDGHTSERITSILEQIDPSSLLPKKFLENC